MHEVTCFRCGHAVHISPDAETCSVCGENLHELLPADYVSSYFYKRATELATKHDPAVALVEAQRGLEYQLSSELLLLAAILAKRQGHYNLMRHCVSAIPVGAHVARRRRMAPALPPSGAACIPRRHPRAGPYRAIAPLQPVIRTDYS